ncbi:MAG: transposase [Pseudomonadota bacterium]
MTLPRSSLVSLSNTPYYHCIGRCVRRAFLCGHDQITGRSFEHRRGWVVEKLAELTSVFSIELAGYAVMSNHYHLVVKINADKATTWSDREVVERWCQLFAGHPLVQRYRDRQSMSAAERERVWIWVSTYRARLADLSWFMRCLNESIARQANAEDGCTGRFWEGRFKSQALLDEAAVIACMAYVDLNPIRAGIADTPETSDFTSIQQRIRSLSPTDTARPSTTTNSTQEKSHSLAQAPNLMALGGQMDQDHALPCSLKDYLALVDWSGRAIHPQKTGAIPAHYPAIIDRLSSSPEALLQYVGNKNAGFKHVVGLPNAIRQAAETIGKTFLHGINAAHRLFPKTA